jgi:hypothetical protein
MSLHVAAQHLASKGRDGDTELVHMTKGEIRGLQGLALAHGGSLSINPDTGLVEASFLKRILPMIAGAGLMMIPGVGPLAAAGMVGGFEGLRTGDIGKGLMAGLGAYGGAGLAQGLSAAGGTAAGLESGAGAVGSDAATMGTTEGMTRALTADTGVGSSMGINSFDAANLGQTPLDPTKVTNFADAYSKGAAPSLTNMGRGIGQLGSEVGRSAVYSGMPTGTLPALGGTVANAMTPEAPPMPGTPEEEERYKGSPYRYNLASNFGGSTPVRPNPYYRPTGLGYAEGGDIMMAAGGTYDDEPMGDISGMAAGGIAGYKAGGLKMKTMSLGEGIARDTDTDTASLNAFEAAKKRMAKINKAANMPKNYTAQMPKVRGLGELAAAAGGSIGGYSDGGRMLKGPGDGMSDSIPATIGKRQPARLADGEFVVPADVVSHIGNGSTDAGARKLYAMMDKVRKARTGKKKQAPAVKTSKFMPA